MNSITHEELRIGVSHVVSARSDVKRAIATCDWITHCLGVQSGSDSAMNAVDQSVGCTRTSSSHTLGSRATRATKFNMGA